MSNNILQNTDKKYNIYANVVIKYTVMRIAENIDEVIEIYDDNDIKNQDINDFWVDENHFYVKNIILWEEYYELAMTLYCNTPVCKYLTSKKLIEDDAKNMYHYFENKLEETAGGSFFVFRSIDYVKIQYALANKTRAGDYIKKTQI